MLLFILGLVKILGGVENVGEGHLILCLCLLTGTEGSEDSVGLHTFLFDLYTEVSS